MSIEVEDDDFVLSVCQTITEAVTSASDEIKPYPLLSDSISVPAVVVQASEDFIPQFNVRMGNSLIAVYQLDVIFLLSKAGKSQVAQKLLYRYLSPRNAVLKAISDIEGLAMEEAGNVGNYSVGDANYWGGTLRVRFEG